MQVTLATFTWCPLLFMWKPLRIFLSIGDDAASMYYTIAFFQTITSSPRMAKS